MKKQFRLALNEYRPLLILRNEERTGLVNVLYLDYMLEDSKIASIGVVYNNGEVLLDLYNNHQQALTGNLKSEEQNSLHDYIHVFESKDDWLEKRVEVVSNKDWVDLLEFYYSTIVLNIKNYVGGFSVVEASMARSPFNAVYVQAVKGTEAVEVRAFNKGSCVYDTKVVSPRNRYDYMALVHHINKCIGGEVVWK